MVEYPKGEFPNPANVVSAMDRSATEGVSRSPETPIRTSDSPATRSDSALFVSQDGCLCSSASLFSESVLFGAEVGSVYDYQSSCEATGLSD